MPTAEPKRISLFALTGIAAASMLVTMMLVNMMRGPEPSSVAAQHPDEMAYEVIQRDRALSASSDPLSGSPVMMPINGR